MMREEEEFKTAFDQECYGQVVKVSDEPVGWASRQGFDPSNSPCMSTLSCVWPSMG